MFQSARDARMLHHASSCSRFVVERQVRLWEKNSKALESAVVVIAHKINRNRKRWTANFPDRRNKILNIFGEVRTDSCALFRNFTRTTANDFDLLLQLIGPRTKKQDTNMRHAIPTSKRLAVTLRFLVTGDSHHTLTYTFHIAVCACNIDHHTRSVPGNHTGTERTREGE